MISHPPLDEYVPEALVPLATLSDNRVLWTNVFREMPHDPVPFQESRNVPQLISDAHYW